MNLNRIFDGLLSSGVAGGVAGGAASALIVQGLSGKKGRKMASKAAKLGGAAVVGGLAWKAYEHYRNDRKTPVAESSARESVNESTVSPWSQTASPSDTQWNNLPQQAFLPESPAPAARRDLLVLRAMIAAAHADGHIDSEERMKIYQRIETLTLSHAEKGLLMEEISAPLTIEQLGQQVLDRAMAAEVYVAAALVADTPEPAHRLFLHDLAEWLELPAGFVASIHQEVGQTTQQAQWAPDPSPNASVSPQA